jgi:NADH-quinone oxidoreductase subunit J
MSALAVTAQWILGIILILSSLGVMIAQKPLYASLSFLLSLLVLATIYLALSAEFIAVMQVLVYAGAILVIFIFVIVLFQDAYKQIARFESQTQPVLLSCALTAFIITLIFFGNLFLHVEPKKTALEEGFGSVQALGKTLYLDFFFPFEAVILLFLVAIVGSLYIAKKEK